MSCWQRVSKSVQLGDYTLSCQAANAINSRGKKWNRQMFEYSPHAGAAVLTTRSLIKWAHKGIISEMVWCDDSVGRRKGGVAVLTQRQLTLNDTPPPPPLLPLCWCVHTWVIGTLKACWVRRKQAAVWHPTLCVEVNSALVRALMCRVHSPEGETTRRVN